MIDFQISPKHQALQARVRAFVRSEFVPHESDSGQGPSKVHRRNLAKLILKGSSSLGLALS